MEWDERGDGVPTSSCNKYISQFTKIGRSKTPTTYVTYRRTPITHQLPYEQESLALASMARDDPPASSTASSTAPASSTAAAMRGKMESEFET